MEIVIILAGLIIVVIIYAVDAVPRAIFRQFVTSNTLNSIKKTTDDPEIAHLIMLAREDLASGSSYHAEAKIKEICARPETALTAFQIAAKSRDRFLRRASILGLVKLKSIDAATRVIILLEVYAISPDTRSEAMRALIDLASIVPFNGDGGFIDILKCVTSTSYSLGNFKETTGNVEKLLRIANQRVDALTIDEYAGVFEVATAYAEEMINSRDIRVRHDGEDFRDNVSRIWSAAQASKKRQEERRKQEEAERNQQWERMRREQASSHQYEYMRSSGNVHPDYYKILQVDATAEPEVIEGAYRRLVKKYHPDVYKAPDADRRMQSINEAYEVLSDSAKRAQYDRRRNS